MSRRKDDKGRVLKTGESQRKDGRYQYRYQDAYGKRQTIYDADLNRLRKKEEIILKESFSGIDYAAGKVTVSELVERYTSLKRGVRYNTKVGYRYVLNLLAKDPFGKQAIGEINVSDAKLWLMYLQDTGKSYETISSIRGIVRPAFQMAYEENAIRRNPFEFKLMDVVVNDTQRRVALTEEQENMFMEFVKNDQTYSKYYYEFVFLLNTGLRVSEFCGLTMDDLDFQKKRIRVDHQLLRDRHCKYFIEETKTNSGKRYIPMTDKVSFALENILMRRPRPRKEMEVDGYKKFLLLDKNERPKVALHIQNEVSLARKKYAKYHPDEPLPTITPHVFRHTFCTNMAYAGMDLKNLQYLMGHSDASVTMNVYTHVNYDRAAEQFCKIVDFTLPEIQLRAEMERLNAKKNEDYISEEAETSVNETVENVG